MSFGKGQFTARKKALAATKSHLGWGRRWIRTPPLGFQVGGLTTRPDLRGLGGICENHRRLGNGQIEVPRRSHLVRSAQNFAAHH